MEFTVNQIAELLSGNVEGDGTQLVNTFSKIQEADKGSLTFLANEKYEQFIYSTGATAIIVSENLVLNQPISPALIRVKEPYAAFSTLLEFYEKAQLSQKTGIENPSYIHDSSNLGSDCYVGAFAYIGKNCTIGNNVKIYPQAYLGDNCKIGDDTIIYPGAKLF